MKHRSRPPASVLPGLWCGAGVLWLSLHDGEHTQTCCQATYGQGHQRALSRVCPWDVAHDALLGADRAAQRERRYSECPQLPTGCPTGPEACIQLTRCRRRRTSLFSSAVCSELKSCSSQLLREHGRCYNSLMPFEDSNSPLSLITNQCCHLGDCPGHCSQVFVYSRTAWVQKFSASCVWTGVWHTFCFCRNAKHATQKCG